MSQILILSTKFELLVLPINLRVYISQQMNVTISVPATHDGIWILITNLPSENADILTVFMHDLFAGNYSHSTDFHTNSQDNASPQNFFSFRGHLLFLPYSPSPPHLILQYHATYSRITSKGQYMKHVHINIDILNSECFSTFNGSVKKYCKVMWHFWSWL